MAVRQAANDRSTYASSELSLPPRQRRYASPWPRMTSATSSFGRADTAYSFRVDSAGASAGKASSKGFAWVNVEESSRSRGLGVERIRFSVTCV